MPTNQDLEKDNLNGRTHSVAIGDSDLKGYHSFMLPTTVGSASIRAISGNEENILISRDNRKNPLGAFFDVVAAVCNGLPMTETSDGKKTVDWGSVWMDDLTFILFQARRLAYGDFFTFHIECPGCGKGYDWEEDLCTTETLYASPEQQKIFSSYGMFSFEMPISGNRLKYKMGTARLAHILQLKRQSDKDSLRTEALRLCVEEWNGKEISPFVSEWTNLVGGDLRFLEQDMNKNRVGINTSVEPICPYCSTMASNVSMPVDSADFLLMPRNLKLRPDGRLTTLWGSRGIKNSSPVNSSDSSLPLKESDLG